MTKKSPGMPFQINIEQDILCLTACCCGRMFIIVYRDPPLQLGRVPSPSWTCLLKAAKKQSPGRHHSSSFPSVTIATTTAQATSSLTRCCRHRPSKSQSASIVVSSTAWTLISRTSHLSLQVPSCCLDCPTASSPHMRLHLFVQLIATVPASSQSASYFSSADTRYFSLVTRCTSARF